MPDRKILLKRLKEKISNKELERKSRLSRENEIENIEEVINKDEKQGCKMNKRERVKLLNRLDTLYRLEEKDEDNAINTMINSEHVDFSDKN